VRVGWHDGGKVKIKVSRSSHASHFITTVISPGSPLFLYGRTHRLVLRTLSRRIGGR
jgi:hypothetical protein